MIWTIVLKALGPLLRLLGLGAVYAKGRSDARTGAALEAAEAYAETRKRTDEVVISDDPGVLRDLLRARDPRKP